MADSTLNRFISAGTAAARAAFTPTPPTPASGAAQGYFWHETDTGDTYSWKAGTGWIKVNVGTVTTTGTPTNGNLTKFSGVSSITNGDLSGDVTTSGTLVVTIANNTVTFAKMQDLSANVLIGAAAAGDPVEISCTAAGRALLDDADAPAQRTTLGLGTAALKSTGQSGDAVPILNGTATTWAAGATFGGSIDLSAGSSFKIDNANVLTAQLTAINDVAVTIATGAGLILALRDNNNGGTALVLYENTLTPIIISQSGSNYVTTAPTGTQIQLANKSGNLGVSAVMAAGQSTNLNILTLTVDTI